MKQSAYDVVILGTGPAGLQAAIHAARAKVSVLVMGRKHKSSLFRAHVENYCCLSGISGEKLLEQGIQQAKDAGAVFRHEDVIETAADKEGFLITTENEEKIRTFALILALGVTRRKLGVPGEKALLGKGVSYCVDCDANFFKGEPVAVVGNESAAVSGALTLLFYAREVNLVTEGFAVSEALEHQVRQSSVTIHEGRKVKRIAGSDAVEGIVLDNDTVLPVTGVFVELGSKGAIELAATLGVALDDEKFQYIQADKQQQTSIPGIFAAGDICGPPWQMAKAVGEGCVAGLEAAKYAKRIKTASA